MDIIDQSVKDAFLSVFPDMKPEHFDFQKPQDQFDQWDSFSHMQLVAAVEQANGVTLEMDDVVAIRTPQDFAEAIKRKKQA
jgi:acyl carrier protein